MPRDIHGVIAMLVTPFTKDYQLDEDALRAEVDWCVQHGANGVVATPSIGEFLHLSEAERIRAFAVTLEQARKHRDIITVAMTSGATTLEALKFAKIAGEMGYDAQQLIPPSSAGCGVSQPCAV
jgi:4-hydroxy-tetrahydrodipicolinate synthase